MKDLQKTEQALNAAEEKLASLAVQIRDLDAQAMQIRQDEEKDLAGAKTAELLALARKRAKAETELRALEVARAELERRCDETRVQLAELKARLRTVRKRESQAELDRQSAEALKVLATFVERAQEVKAEQDRMGEIGGFTLQSTWSLHFLELCESQAQKITGKRG